MQHTPLIHQYIDAMHSPYGLFRTLNWITAEEESRDRLFYRAGNYSVIFRVRDAQGSRYALKCYTRIPPRLETVYATLSRRTHVGLVHGCYLPDEIYIHSSDEEGNYFPVIMMEWIEGESLGHHAGRLCAHNDISGLRQLAESFDRLAIELLDADFAHGDLKQDNIIVLPSGELRLIDYDGAYLPRFEGMCSTLIGSPLYQHPRRDPNYFNKHIDDYPIALIALSLHALIDDPSLFARYNDGENIIFDAQELNAGRSELFNRLMRQWNRNGQTALFALGRLMTRLDPAIDNLRELIEGLLTEGHLSVTIDNIQLLDTSDPHWAVCRLNGRFGYVDLIRRRMQLQPIYLDAKPFSEELAVVDTGNGLCIIDRSGRCHVDCKDYQQVEPFRCGRALIYRNNYYSYIDHKGRPCGGEYRYAGSYHENLAVVQAANGLFGYIDLAGHTAIECCFDHAGCFRQGTAEVELSGHRFSIDRHGNPIGIERLARTTERPVIHPIHTPTTS